MNTHIPSIEELLSLAKTTNCLDVLNKLTLHVNSTIRRAVARNQNSSSLILEKLAHDPVENVSYMAVNNPNCNVSRNFKISNPCVICEKDERSMKCTECDTLKDYYCSLNKK